MTSSQRPVRIAPLEGDQLTPEVRDRLGGSWGLGPGLAPPKPSTVRATLVRHEKMFDKWDPFGSALFNGEMPAREREVLILRVAWHLQCAPEWAYHVGPAKHAGITDTDIEAIVEGPSSPSLAEIDRLMVCVVDQLRQSGTIDDTTWKALAARYTTEQLIEIPMIVGHYTMVAYAMNAFGTPAPEGAPPVPERSQG